MSDIEKNTFFYHFTELRNRVIFCTITYIVLFVPFFIFSDFFFKLLTIPYQKAIKDTATELYFAPLEFIITKVKLSLYLAFITLLPIILWNLYAFVNPALYKKEKKIFIFSVLFFPIMFLCGMALVYFYIMPFVMDFALNMELRDNKELSVTIFVKVSEYLSLITSLMFVTGLMFQMPAIIWVLVKTNIVSIDSLKSYRKYVFFVIFIIAAIFTPPDPFSQIIVGLFLYLLYEISIILSGTIR